MDELVSSKVSIPQTANKYIQRISAFINVPSHKTEKNVPQLLTRHKQLLPPTNNSKTNSVDLLLPISDQTISYSLSKLKFNHPYTLISFLNDPNHEPPLNIDAILQPFCLYQNNPQCDSEKLIPLLASLFGKKPNEFLVYFQGQQINEKAIRSSWTQLFIDPNDPNSKEKVATNEMPYFFERLISNFPTENWSLNTLEDLYSLHVLSCAMKIKLILIFPPISSRSKSTYSLCIGRRNSSYCIYVGILTKDRFFIAEPLLKQKRVKNPPSDSTNLLKTFQTIDKNFAIYYDYQTSTTEPQDVTSYSGTIFVLPNIDRPSIEITQHNTTLNINVRIPTFNQENKVILKSFLESICDSVTEINRQSSPSDANNQVSHISLENGFKFVGKTFNSYYLMSRTDEKKNHEYSDFVRITSPSQLMAVCKEIVDQEYVFDGSDDDPTQLSHLQAMRILAGNALSTRSLSIAPSIDDVFKPIFLPKTSRISLADCCNSKYAEDICTLSVLRYCIGSGFDDRICSKPFGCGLPIPRNTLMLPIRNKTTNELTFICSKCIAKQSRMKQKAVFEDAFSATNNKDALIMRLYQSITKPNYNGPNVDIYSYIATYENNLRYLHEHPIGYLRQMINMIDNAFSTLQHILYAKSLIEINREASLSKMLGIRNENEASIQITNIKSLAVVQPIDYELFKQYLLNQADIQYSSSLYHFVKRNDEIMLQIDESIEKNYIDSMTEKLQRKQSETVPSYSIQCHSNDQHCMDYQITFDSIGNEIKPTTKYTYKLYPIDNTSHLSLSPVTILKTSKNIFNIWKYDESSLVILAYDNADTAQYTNAYIYHIPFGTYNLDYSRVYYKLENVRLSCADLCASNAEHVLAIYYENPQSQNLMKIDFHSNTIHDGSHEYSQVYDCFYAFDKKLYTYCLLDGPVLINSDNDNEFSIKQKYDEIAFIGNPFYLLSLDSEGNIQQLNEDLDLLQDESDDEENSNHEEEEEQNSKMENVSIKEPLFICINSDDQPGITNLKRKDEGNYEVQFFVTGQLYSNFQTKLAPGTTEAFFNQYGYADDYSKPNEMYTKETKTPNLNTLNLHLTAAEFFPVLVSYESHGLQFVVTNHMEPFSASKQNESFPSNIRSAYTRLYSHISLHQVEEVIRCNDLQVNLVSFIGDIANNDTARFIDTIFGTRFASVTQEGIYVGVRVINGIAHLITFFNCVSNNQDQLMRQLSAVYRASNYVCICTSTLINSLNFLKEWTESIPDAYVLLPELPVMNTFFFNSSGDLSRMKLNKYRMRYNIDSEIVTVPRRQSWNTQTLDLLPRKSDDNEEEEPTSDDDDDEENDLNQMTEEEDENEFTHIKHFISKIEDIVHCLKAKQSKATNKPNQSNNETQFRPPDSASKGIGFAIEQIATYLTLNEFKDFPIDTVLKYCHLQLI